MPSVVSPGNRRVSAEPRRMRKFQADNPAPRSAAPGPATVSTRHPLQKDLKSWMNASQTCFSTRTVFVLTQDPPERDGVEEGFGDVFRLRAELNHREQWRGTYFQRPRGGREGAILAAEGTCVGGKVARLRVCRSHSAVGEAAPPPSPHGASGNAGPTPCFWSQDSV